MAPTFFKCLELTKKSLKSAVGLVSPIFIVKKGDSSFLLGVFIQYGQLMFGTIPRGIRVKSRGGGVTVYFTHQIV